MPKIAVKNGDDDINVCYFGATRQLRHTIRQSTKRALQSTSRVVGNNPVGSETTFFGNDRKLERTLGGSYVAAKTINVGIYARRLKQGLVALELSSCCASAARLDALHIMEHISHLGSPRCNQVISQVVNQVVNQVINQVINQAVKSSHH